MDTCPYYVQLEIVPSRNKLFCSCQTELSESIEIIQEIE